MIPKFAVIGSAIVLITVINIVYYIGNTDYSAYLQVYHEVSVPSETISLPKGPSKYLINTTNCQIPDIDPFSQDIMKFVWKEEYTNCTNLELLTYIEKDFGMVTLNIKTSLLSQYSSFGVTCCYSEIHRVEGNDDKIRLTTCVNFKDSVAIFHPFIKVVCRNTFFMTVYENVHATTLLSDIHYINNQKNKSRFSVLLVGIDSISKQNLQRTMPKSYKYLEENFINLKGYNKVGDNTYPNLMAILTGQNMEQVYENCPFSVNSKDKSKDKDFLSRCDFIWKRFSKLGYVTALSEDACPLGTFNYAKRGFFDPPTDYYYRPYFLAVEELSTLQSKCHNRFCSGPENTGERIMNTAKDFTITLRDKPKFGLFWTNTFSHDNINCPSAMDDKISQFLSDESFTDTLDDTILVFFSDHGYRFGDIRHTVSGWLEERLPFTYLRIPQRFQELFPEEYNNLLVNSERLTSPYDLYNTLQHILELSGGERRTINSPGCEKCMSLFHEISDNRTCDEAGVSQHWCTCTSYNNLSTADSGVTNIASFVVQEINSLVQSFPEGGKCNDYSLDSVHSAGMSRVRISEEGDEVNNVLVMINTKPEAKFEATVEVVKGSHHLKLLGEISRIDQYGGKSSCIENSELKKYCYCGTVFDTLKNRICRTLHVC